MIEPVNHQLGNDAYEPSPGLDGASPAPPMIYVTERTRWEYKVVSMAGGLDDAKCEQELNSLGSAGWELTNSASQAEVVRYVFKRPRN